LIDLFVISVLLDAGSGNKWSYRSKESGKIFRRSEGLAVASLEMFKAGMFSSDPTEPCQVDGAGLKKISVEVLARGMQHSDQNPLAGIEGRAGLLARLSEALNNQELFGVDARPGNMLGNAQPHFTQSAVVYLLTTAYRLSSFSSVNAGMVRAYNHGSHSLVCSHGWPGANMASITDKDRWHVHWRCLALLRPTFIPASTTLGKHCSVPQAHPVALLLDYGPNVEVAKYPVL
jgi:hypothetical protein